jgi:hypothetical protein
MIGIIIKLLQQDDFLNVSKNVEIAKGKYELPKDFKGLKNKIKRQWLLRK